MANCIYVISEFRTLSGSSLSLLCMQTEKDSMLKQEFLDQLPKKLIWNSRILYQWEAFWYSAEVIQGIRNFQSHFQPRSDDIFLASSMKTGTTWLKALCVSIIGIKNKDPNGGVEDELQLKNPHEHVRTLEYDLYFYTSNPDLSGMQSPRLFHTHLPYSALPDSIKNSDSKIVYITRNPKDTFVSLWHYLNKVTGTISEPYPIEKFYDEFREGLHYFGPNLDHVLQYWSESLKMPNKILLLKYEDLKRDPKGEVKRLALFLGRPFVNEDEVDKVLWRSSLDRLKNLEVNKNGAVFHSKIPKSSFFRRGVIGDWKNYLTAEMDEGLDEITRKKLEGSGLKFETN